MMCRYLARCFSDYTSGVKVSSEWLGNARLYLIDLHELLRVIRFGFAEGYEGDVCWVLGVISKWRPQCIEIMGTDGDKLAFTANVLM